MHDMNNNTFFVHTIPTIIIVNDIPSVFRGGLFSSYILFLSIQLSVF